MSQGKYIQVSCDTSVMKQYVAVYVFLKGSVSIAMNW